MKKSLLVVLAVAVVAIGGYALYRSVLVPQPPLGANPGPVFSNPLEFQAGVTNSNYIATTSSSTSYTLIGRDFVGYDVVSFLPKVGDITLTLPASSTISNLVPRAGNLMRQCWYNATTTAGIDITFAAGTGIDLETSSTSPTDLTLHADSYACFSFIRKAATASAFDIGVLMTEYNNAD